MRIVLAVDGSPVATRAARHVAMLHKQFSIKPDVFVLFVDQPLLSGFANYLGRSGVDKYHADNGNYAMKGAKAVLTRAGVQYTGQVLIGDPAQTIVKFAKSSKSDQLIMGSHGRGAFKNLVLGSVATKVLSQCMVPVTIVR